MREETMPDGMMPDARRPAFSAAAQEAEDQAMIGGGGSMKNDELDRILVEQEGIQPSSGFAASVMEAVREEAAAPPPIPFPWKRALPVLVFAALALVVVVAVGAVSIVQLSRGEVTSQIAFSLWDFLPASARGSAGASVAWTAAALLAAFVSVKLSMRLGAGRA